MFNSSALETKWAKVLDSKDAGVIKEAHRRAVTAVLLENQAKELASQKAALTSISESTGTGAVANWDPILISLVRRAMPNLVAYDIAGVQPMTGPTGLIFAMKSKYQSTKGAVTTGDEALGLAEPVSAFSGPVATATGEALSGDYASPGNTGGFANMGFSIEKSTVTAQTRALKADYTMELAQDLKAVHGLDADAEISNILATEILAEINREIVGLVNSKAKAGATAGAYDLQTDADGRWAVEKFKSLLFQIEKEANTIAKETRRGKGNFVLCSSNVASALAAAGVLTYAPAMSTDLHVDDTGNLFAGTIMGRMKVFVDPYAVTDYATVGYRGSNPYDAGLFYAPYVPLTMVRAVDNNTFQPKIAFKTRYGVVANPFVAVDGVGTNAANPYFRKFTVANINVGTGVAH
jgi:hypothetical protein